jgi:3-oxoacyl-[acyl-carrier protein] reductase
VVTRTALVTGAASGIGKATVDALRADGLQVFGLDLTSGGEGILSADVSNTASVADALESVAMTSERIDVLVNNAGILIESRLREMRPDDLDRMLAVNVRGPFIVTQAVLPLMPDGGRIVNVASELAYLGRAGASGYSATKGAVLSMTRSWARELGPKILVNAVAPGPVDTSLLGFAGMNAEEQALETANPLGRIGRPEEIASVIAFLAGPKAGFITGQCFSADGGAAMH